VLALVRQTFVTHIRDAFLRDGRAVSAPELRCLERALKVAAGCAPLTDAEDDIEPSLVDIRESAGQGARRCAPWQFNG